MSADVKSFKDMTVNERIKKYFELHFITQGKVADKAMIDRSKLNRVINSNNFELGHEEIQRLIIALNVSPCEFFYDPTNEKTQA